jgi:hypothetical protein
LASLAAMPKAGVTKTDKRFLRMNLRVGDGEGAIWLSVMAFDQSALE